VQAGARIAAPGAMWNYAAGIPHPQPHFAGHGLSLVPPKSALWLDAAGRRIGPAPLVTGFDTPDLCRQVAAQAQPWTWQLLNRRIARRELAISGAEHNPASASGSGCPSWPKPCWAATACWTSCCARAPRCWPTNGWTAWPRR
jgi:predicted oxidoreductase